MRYQVVACLAALIVTGCATDPVAPVPVPAPAPAPAPSSVPGPPPAADGQDVGACADGTCEVRVTGPVTVPLPAGSTVSNLRVESIDATGVQLAGNYPGGSVTGSQCSVAVSSGSRSEAASFSGQCDSGGKLTFDKLTISVVAVQPDAAVLRIAPR